MKSHIFKWISALLKKGRISLIKRHSNLSAGDYSQNFGFIFPEISHFRWYFETKLKIPIIANFSPFLHKIVHFRCKFDFQVNNTIINKISAELRLFRTENKKNRVSWPTDSFEFCTFQKVTEFYPKCAKCESGPMGGGTGSHLSLTLAPAGPLRGVFSMFQSYKSYQIIRGSKKR